jgi:PBP1b-binding outer membrane lipoprotein LpoB
LRTFLSSGKSHRARRHTVLKAFRSLSAFRPFLAILPFPTNQPVTTKLRKIPFAVIALAVVVGGALALEGCSRQKNQPVDQQQPAPEAEKLPSPPAASLVSKSAEDVIAKARAFLGGDKLLDAVQSTHMVGKVTYDDGSSGTIELIFQRPCNQRVVITTAKTVEITALDDYEGWTRVQDSKDPTRWQLTLLSKDQIKMLRANTIEQLSFFRNADRRGTLVEDLGDAVVDGRSCRKLSFKRDDGSIFVRYFDAATGELVLIETPQQGGRVREEGVILAGGIRFAQRHVQTTKNADGKVQTIKIDYDRVTVNETFPESLFAVPSVGSR